MFGRTLRCAWLLLAVCLLPVAFFGCEKVGPISSVPTSGPTATPTVSPTPSGTSCNTQSTNPNAVIVGIASAFLPATDPTYGNIGGYAVIDPTGASPAPDTTTRIDKTVSGAQITAANTLQFVNLEVPGSTIIHSAVGFLSGNFPAKPYAFPQAAASPSATAITSVTQWSTGLLNSPPTTNCFSQEFTLSPGTYYFGDLNYYNITTFQDVLIVSP